MLTSQLLKSPGFVYGVNGTWYYLGKWICKECTITDATDSAVMYQICRKAGEEAETNLYFQKLRAFSDFALEIPHNPEKIKADTETLLKSLPASALASLTAQYQCFTEDLLKYCGESI